jgi:hypothetical protein
MYEQTPFSGKSLEDLVAWLQDNHRSIAVELNAKLGWCMLFLNVFETA